MFVCIVNCSRLHILYVRFMCTLLITIHYTLYVHIMCTLLFAIDYTHYIHILYLHVAFMPRSTSFLYFFLRFSIFHTLSYQNVTFRNTFHLIFITLTFFVPITHFMCLSYQNVTFRNTFRLIFVTRIFLYCYKIFFFFVVGVEMVKNVSSLFTCELFITYQKKT